MRNIVDIFITTKDEQLAILDKTIQSALAIDYPNKRVYVLDDGSREELKKLCVQLGCNYLSRNATADTRYKAYNLNNGLRNSHGNFILTLDADSVVLPTIIDDLLGFFNDENIALVATRQGFEVEKKDFNHENLFYEYMQTGKNTYGAGISTGSGVIYRRSALEKVGGFQTWNIVEDLYTSYVLNQNGYRTIYIPQSYIYGDAPIDLGTIYKQRGLWAQDTLRMMIWKSPFFAQGLSIRQRLAYLEIGYAYIVSGIILIVVYLINIYSILMNDPIIYTAPIWYFLLKIPSFIFTINLFNYASRGSDSSRMWAGLFPVYARACFRALLYKKPPYKVTVKSTHSNIHIALIVPQVCLIFLGINAISYHLARYGITFVLAVDLVWFCITLFFQAPVILRGLGVYKPH